LIFLLFSLAAVPLVQLAAKLSPRMARDTVFSDRKSVLSQHLCGPAGFFGFLPLAGFLALGYAGVLLLRGPPKAASVLDFACIDAGLSFFG